MKKGTFNNFLGRKTQSLFDTNIQIKERDNVELVIDSSAIPESGTAKVRARPTVKHFNSSTYSSDPMQGFAVPTPRVPVLPFFNGPNTNGTGGKLSNGVSIPDLVEGEIFIPPPPSMAPPPPPPPPQVIIPPPPDFSFDSIPSRQAEDLASLQPPPMPPPKPPSKTPSPNSSWDPDLASLKPPSLAPPKPPSDPSSKISAPISTPLINGPECPKFAPPKPPASAESLPTTLPRAQKVPPPKPTRLSSISGLDNLPLSPAPAPPAPTPSSFNPQNTAKLYNIPKPGILSREPDLEKPQRPILYLQDTPTDPIPVQVNGKMPSDNKDLLPAKSHVPPTKPARRNSSGIQLEKDLQDLKKNLQSTLPAEVIKVQEDAAVTPPPLQTPQDLNKPTQPTPTASPVPKNTPPATPYANSPGRSRKHIPYVSRTPYYRRSNENNTPAATSPLALLLAAKEREKQRGSLSRENSTKSNSYSEPTTVSIHQSQSTPNSFTVIPRSTSSLSHDEQESPEQQHLSSMDEFDLTARVTDSASASPSRPLSSSSLVAELLEKHDTETAPTAPGATCVEEVKDEDAMEDVCVPFIPPPPEFANSYTEEESSLEQAEPPPSFPPPDPPLHKVSSPSPTPDVQLPRSMGPAPPPKPKAAKPPSPPKLPVQKVKVKSKPASQDKLKLPPPPAPAASLSHSQATLLSILQKKMLEMDQKHSFQEVNSNNDDWGSSEEPTVPVWPNTMPKSKSTPVALSTPPSQSPGLDMSELERKVAKKAQDLSTATESATSNGAQSKQPYGMTFTVRPGTKQPITPVIKGDTP
ncbi:hypothetical protein SKAU_G00171920 [Synaphobranchus kaupii]|uniref:Uncharacterized protein n=1 Tax=Synaphobranchus kaupii TaxID=118154 RepID=A0A9Q1FKJ3_SYNKA|nr:hypothetical protein SKAU_G00171920 [Synaphobranchus kaupii]